MNIRRCHGVYEPSDDSFLFLNIKEIEGKLLEIGCGTGIIGLSFAEKGVEVVMTDVSREAVACARKNAKENGLNAAIVRADLFSGLRGRFDYIIFNPPYLPSDPPDDPTWTGGRSGNEKTLEFLKGFGDLGKIAFYVESSLAPVPRGEFRNKKFTLIAKMGYDFEDLLLVKVEADADD